MCMYICIYVSSGVWINKDGDVYRSPVSGDIVRDVSICFANNMIFGFHRGFKSNIRFWTCFFAYARTSIFRQIHTMHSKWNGGHPMISNFVLTILVDPHQKKLIQSYMWLEQCHHPPVTIVGRVSTIFTTFWWCLMWHCYSHMLWYVPGQNGWELGADRADRADIGASGKWPGRDLVMWRAGEELMSPRWISW